MQQRWGPSMKSEKMNEKVNYILNALQNDCIDTLTKEALVKAFNDEGIFDLEGVADRIVRRTKKDRELLKIEARLIDFSQLSKPTPPSVARGIVHPAPEIPFMIDGIIYDPRDISRFNGEALVYIPTMAADGSKGLQLFHERVTGTMATYLETRHLASLLFPDDIQIPGVNPPRTPGDNSNSGWNQGPPNLIPPSGSGASGRGDEGNTGSKPFIPPTTEGQVQMFDGANFNGDWFWMARGRTWSDLTKVSRGGWFGGDWNDAIMSLSSTGTSCIYCEHINLEGSKLYIGHYQAVSDLTPLAWQRRISSAWNFDF
jgi:hypothetical protein